MPRFRVGTPKKFAIGLHGYSRAGKDTVADYFVQTYGFTKLSFAAALKSMAARIGPEWLVDSVEKHGWEQTKAEHPKSVDYLINLGQYCRKVFGEDIWIKCLDNKIEEYGWPTKVVISDVRFPNEVEWIADQRWNYFNTVPGELLLNNRLIHVVRPGTEPKGSDTALSDNDLGRFELLRNDGSIEDLHANIEKWIKRSNMRKNVEA